MSGRQQPKADDRTGTYGGDDGALENERALIAPGEDPGAIGLTEEEELQQGKTPAERKQEKDLKTGTNRDQSTRPMALPYSLDRRNTGYAGCLWRAGPHILLGAGR